MIILNEFDTVGQKASLVLVQLQVLQEFLQVLTAEVFIINASNLKSSFHQPRNDVGSTTKIISDFYSFYT